MFYTQNEIDWYIKEYTGWFNIDTLRAYYPVYDS